MRQEIERESVWKSKVDPERNVTVLGTVTNLGGDRLVVYQYSSGDTAHQEVGKFLALYDPAPRFAVGDIIETVTGSRYLIAEPGRAWSLSLSHPIPISDPWLADAKKVN